MLPLKAADTTRILGKLLDGYDKRLRPDFGGKLLHLLAISATTIIKFKS